MRTITCAICQAPLTGNLDTYGRWGAELCLTHRYTPPAGAEAAATEILNELRGTWLPGPDWQALLEIKKAGGDQPAG